MTMDQALKDELNLRPRKPLGILSPKRSLFLSFVALHLTIQASKIEIADYLKRQHIRRVNVLKHWFIP